MISLVGMFAKARTYVVQSRPYNRRKKAAEAGWAHAAQFNYDGKYTTKRTAEIRAMLFASRLGHATEYRILNVTVKQAHKMKTATYRPEGDLKKLKAEFDYDKKCRRHPTIPHVANARKTDEKLGSTALAMKVKHEPHKWHKDADRLRKAMAYYELAQGY